jgi:hypothetical protein
MHGKEAMERNMLASHFLSSRLFFFLFPPLSLSRSLAFVWARMLQEHVDQLCSEVRLLAAVHVEALAENPIGNISSRALFCLLIELVRLQPRQNSPRSWAPATKRIFLRFDVPIFA